jgi:large subunit ribosomal protein L22
MSFAIRARARYIPMSPRKARLVLDVIRGKPVEEALAILRLLPKAACLPVAKLIRSAAANAESVYGLDQEELFVAEIAADGGPIAKRGRFAARGRWKPIRKRSCHISVGLREIPAAAGTAAPAGAPQEDEAN